MELIFENVEERDEFFMMHVCPSKCGGTDFTGFDCMRRKCIECWEQSGVKYRVKPQVCIEFNKPLDKKLERELVKQIEKYTNQPTPDNPVPIEEQAGCYTEIVINKPLRPGDRVVCENGVWGVVRKKPELGPLREPLKPCEECKHSDVHEFDEPCRSCSGNSKFEEKEEDQRCKTCKYRMRGEDSEPCKSCAIKRSNWEPVEQKESIRSCESCMFYKLDVISEPCNSCVQNSKWEKDAK